MSWFLVYETATGRLVSQGTVLADPLPRGLTSVDVGTKPDDSLMWDEASRSMVPRPTRQLVDRVDDVVADVRIADALKKFSPAELDAFKEVVGEALGSERFRAEK